MQQKLSPGCTVLLVSLMLMAQALRPARAADAVTGPAAAGGGIAAHVARFDFSEEWGETIDWAKLDLMTRELARDRLDWNALCMKAVGKSLSESADGLSTTDTAKFMAILAEDLKKIADRNHLVLTQNDWAIVGCAVVPMQQVKGSGQKYVTGLGDTSRLGAAIVKLVGTGVNCGDGCVLTHAVLSALHIEARFVGCHRKVSDPSQPVGHAMIEYFETNAGGRRFGHIVDATNMSPYVIAGEPVFRPPASRFQHVGDKLGRLQFLIGNSFLHEQPRQQGFDPPFAKDELASPDLADFATARWEARLDSRSVVLDSTKVETTAPEGKSLVYKISLGKDIGEGAAPIARMYRKGPDGAYAPLTSFSLHRRSDSKEVRLVWDTILDGLTPGDYRVDFYIDEGGYGFGRRGTYAGEQIVHYGAKEGATL